MKISIKHYGWTKTGANISIEMICEDGNNRITSFITDNNGHVDVIFIENLREIADTLEEQNNRIDAEK